MSFEAVELDGAFYQDAAFFPMPVVLVASCDGEGQPNLAPYSLVFPQPAAGEQVLMLIIKRETKTAANLRATGRASLCFLSEDPKLLDACMRLARMLPSAEKLADTPFTWEDRNGCPLVQEAQQVFVTSLLEETQVDGERRFLLRVDEVVMRPRWKRSLARGWGAPRLAVEYGFRGSSPRWLSRPRAVFDGPALRPSFELRANMAVEDAIDSLKRALSDPDSGVEGHASRDSAQVNIPHEEASFWSPELQIRVDEVDGRARVRGRIGPHPHVWMLFTGLHLAIGLSATGGLMFGISQWILGVPPTALAAVPIGLALSGFVAGAAFIGQGLGAAHVYRLRAFVDQALER